eukprot:CAMPEP_0168551938 /NCGR_PEP_ID=MMETSP0413-20121227/6447_1 /TAXON_ID=136452 /ORGANISM="Filamoeba nolandi, Strain NC-AS-23-1" /LENGTH=222 /DNA_ID=CAMNT_0008582513 /DNA_START=37 /DNA_END=705 /DNA_ORIENTATION=-
MANKTNQQIEEEEGFGNLMSGWLGKPARITDYLLLGSVWDAKTPEMYDQLGVGFVLNVAEEALDYSSKLPPDVEYMKLVVQDYMEDSNQYDTFEQAYQFIEKAKKATKENASQPGPDGKPAKTKCLVHCMRGRSRSCAIILGYLMQKYRWTLLEAFLYVKEKRPVVGPHHYLRSQLLEYELHIMKQNTITSLSDWGRLDTECHKAMKQRKALDYLKNRQTSN